MPPEKSWGDAESSPALHMSSVHLPWDLTTDPGGVQAIAFAFAVSVKTDTIITQWVLLLRSLELNLAHLFYHVTDILWV